jgi:hypothetical protein
MISLSEINNRIKKCDDKIKRATLSVDHRAKLRKERRWLRQLGCLLRENKLEDIDDYYYLLFFDFKTGRYNKEHFNRLIGNLSEKTIQLGFCPISDYLKDETYKLLGEIGV